MTTPYQFLAQTKKCFAFLGAHGFHSESEYEGGYASFASGFNISYASKELSLSISYGAMELEVTFKRGKISTSYLFLDHNLFANASGFAGGMFPRDKLAPAIDAIAKDIETNYDAVLRGDADVWKKIEKLVLAPKEAKPYLP